MSERNPRPANSTKVPWPSATYGTTDPSSQRAAGWAPSEVPASEEFNFLQKMWGEEFTWLLGYLAREWADINEATPSSMSIGELFAVVPPTGGASARGSAIFSGVSSGATGGGYIYYLNTDGEFGYYVSGGGTVNRTHIVKFDMSDGSLIKEAQAYSGNVISALAVDGSAVFTMGANAANTGLSRWARADLSGPTTVGTEYGCSKLAANGYHAAATGPNSGAGKVVVYSDINGTIAEDGSYDTGSSALGSVDVDAENAYTGGARSTYDVWSVVLSSRALNWRITLPTSTTPTVSGVATDGDMVYVSSTRETLTAGGSANLYCLDRMTGAVLWSADIGSGSSDLNNLALDDKYLYTDDGTTSFQIDKRSTGVVQHMVAHGFIGENGSADGISVLATPSISTFSRYWTQPQARKLFVRMKETDPWRMPFHHIVNPG
jgi:hypothetical protein